MQKLVKYFSPKLGEDVTGKIIDTVQEPVVVDKPIKLFGKTLFTTEIIVYEPCYVVQPNKHLFVEKVLIGDVVEFQIIP